ncbi:MAG: recombinase family protein [Ilumatobacteraceae bacterium]|nr:recombinase family protein [Ilumatobacteraceae bacterium]
MDGVTTAAARAVVYLRVSTKEQAERGGGEGFSIPAQREATLRKAASLSAQVVEEFIDAGESAKTSHRPELRRLLEYLKAEPVQFVIVHKVDRLARNRVDDVEINVAIRATGATLVSCTENIDETPSGALMHGIMSSIAEFYSKNLANEVIKGSVQKAKAGGTPGKAPTGYLNVRRFEHGREIRTIEIDPERGPLMAWAFEEYATGEWSVRTLLAELTKRGLNTTPSARMPSKPLVLSNFNRLLRNPYYRGTVTYRGVQYDGAHPPLVSAETWNRVQDVLTQANTSGDKHKVHSHYLTGSLFCGDCGERMIISMNTGRRGTVYPYFICVGRQQKRGRCQQRAVLIEVIEAEVEDHYAGIQPTRDEAAQVTSALTELLRSRRQEADVERSAQERRLRKLNDERTKLMEAYYDNAVPKDLFKSEQARIAAETDAASSRLAALSAHFDQVEQNLNRSMDLAADWHAAYLSATGLVRRQMNQAIFSKLYVHEDGRISSELAEPFNILLSSTVADFATRVAKADDGAGPSSDTIDHAWEQLSAEWTAEAEMKNPRRTACVGGSRVNLLVGAEGLEPPTSSL